ncbi:MAG: hypothetical protein B7733_08750 [Myxococcales bacterium FL481]|nr:MAG: hypothetical protein B7733_08750 [Myxococcales bacterium FL481]
MALTSASARAGALEPEPDDSFEVLYRQGDRAYEAERFTEAAELWRQALESQPETEETSATRANVLSQLLTAYVDAYRESDDREHLVVALEVAAVYESELSQVYGAAWSLPPHVAAAVRDVSRRLELHDGEQAADDATEERAAQDETASTPVRADPQEDLLPKPDGWRDQGDGRVLFGGGVATTVFGVAALGPAIWGAAESIRSASARRSSAVAAEEQGIDSVPWEEIEKHGWFDDQEARIAVGSAIAAVVLVTAGTIMTTIAFRKARSHRATHTRYVNVTRTYAGGGWSVRF